MDPVLVDLPQRDQQPKIVAAGRNSTSMQPKIMLPGEPARPVPPSPLGPLGAAAAGGAAAAAAGSARFAQTLRVLSKEPVTTLSPKGLLKAMA